jgi:hypothetical protein
MFWIVRKLFVVEEALLASRKHKHGSAIHARQISVSKVHVHFRQSRCLPRGCAGVLKMPFTAEAPRCREALCQIRGKK